MRNLYQLAGPKTRLLGFTETDELEMQSSTAACHFANKSAKSLRSPCILLTLFGQ